MNSPLDQLTPHQIRKVARFAAMMTAVGLGLGYVTNMMQPLSAGIGSFVLSCALLLAAPRQRATELLGAVAVWQCFAEFLSTMQSGDFQMWRLAVSVGTLGIGIAIIRVQHLRDLMRTSPQARIADLDQRTVSGIGVLPRTEAQLAELRKDQAA